MESVITPFTRRWGTGGNARVLLVHGVCAYSGAWWRIGSRLSESGCTVVAPDLRGHGQSPSAESYTFAAMAADLASVGEGWDLIVGHSLGAAIACRVAASDPDTRSLLLLDPFLDAPEDEFDGLLDGLLAELDPHATAESVADVEPTWHPEDCFHKAVGARLTSPYVVERCLRDNAPYHHMDLIDSADAQVHILGSDPERGGMFAPSWMSAVHDRRASYRMVTGAGHSLQRERPDAVIEAARALLAV